MTKVNLFTLLTTSINNNALPKKVNFKSNEYLQFNNLNNFEGLQDSFNSNPISDKFKTKPEIEQLAKANPRIMALLKENNLPLKVNIDILEEMR